MTYGERLRELRAERRLSLRQVEERGGPNKDTMSLIERDVHKPHPQTLGRIADALELSVSELRTELEAAENPLAQAPPEPKTVQGSVHLEVDEEAFRALVWALTGEILTDLEHGRVEEAKSKLLEFMSAA